MLIDKIAFTTVKKSNSPDSIIRQFERTRNDYLADLEKLRNKYAATFAQLTLEYSDACALQK